MFDSLMFCSLPDLCLVVLTHTASVSEAGQLADIVFTLPNYNYNS